MFSALIIFLTFSLFLATSNLSANSNVHITRFWHNHQPIYWPEWNSGVGQDFRVQYAHDSIRLKPNQNYGAAWNHPHNDLEQIFGLNDRLAAYQFRPRNALTQISNSGGFALSYTGSLIDNIRNLASNNWNYDWNWNSYNTEARQWETPSGNPRLDLVGFSYHHSLNPLLPKSVLRKEIQIFKEAWWKAWGGDPDKSDHSLGYFPTEMAYSRDIIDILVDEGYDWVIVASHHISRTSPSYNDFVNPTNFQIKSSPPNKADQIGPRFDNSSQWWFAEPNPGQAAWNVAPFAYQLHRVTYIDPATGEEKSMIAVPSDDILSYQAGYSGAQIGIVDSEISPWATDPNRPVLVMPATDGDNAWGGGFDSWEVSTPQFFGAAEARGYQLTTIQDFVSSYGQYAPNTHIEEGAWIYPEMCYGSPYFLKWIEPPVAGESSLTRYPNTVIDIRNGWSLKFFAYAPKMAGANWVETAEQIWTEDGGSVDAWKIQSPYDWDGSWTEPNIVELAWHIYLKGLDSGFQYYGGLGNDDETKPGLATRRAIETLQDFLSNRLEDDRTPPTVLKPQRFPYNPGGYTFGWFNSVPGEDTNYLKRNPSEFYIWTLVYDISGVESVDLMIRRDKDGVRSLLNNHNETYAGGHDVEDWMRIPMTRRVLPNSRNELNSLANNGQIDFVVTSPEIADQWYVYLDESNLPTLRDNLFDYYIEAIDTHGNVQRTDIQHVYVEDDSDFIQSQNGSAGGENGDGDFEDGNGTSPGNESPSSFSLGNASDPLGYLLDSPGMRIFAAVREENLYVATWTPTGGVNDHFILISSNLREVADVPAPWNKAGFTAHPSDHPYLGAESENDFVSWFNAGEGSDHWRSSMPGGRVEGTLDLREAFGEIPDRLFIAAVAYETADGGQLVAQAPEGNGSGNLEPEEFLSIPTNFLDDSNGVGLPDILNPQRRFRGRLYQENKQMKMSVPVLPGRTYRIESSTDLIHWTPLPDSAFTPVIGDNLSIDLPLSGSDQNFFRLVWE